ncbi:primosomal protein N' [Nocardia huaxiensis]|uniref:Probable replication restart protein PriA n=2 Tax=Nocardia huaxiensis TaxID=2755382 RepID=A0A7D7A347_9NOCA|nr:primosomal protein N' [Nocardia huaxiensis]
MPASDPTESAEDDGALSISLLNTDVRGEGSDTEAADGLFTVEPVAVRGDEPDSGSAAGVCGPTAVDAESGGGAGRSGKPRGPGKAGGARDSKPMVAVALPVARVLPLLEPAHLDRDFDYVVPPEMDETAQPGVRVRVRFSGRLVDGFVLERLEKSSHAGKLVRLERVVSGERVLTPEILRLVEAVAARYAGTRADVLRLAIPPRHAKTEAEEPKPVELPEIPEQFPAWERYTHASSLLAALREGKGPRAAWQALPGEDWARRLAELAAVTVAGGRSAVLLVPDQRDLERLMTECTALVGDSAVGLAAGLGPTVRYRRWLAALRGTARIVVGTRSTVFAPVRDLGLIAIWDDGDDTYAEPRAPYSHAREVAMLRAHETGAAFVAGGFARTAEVQAIVESGWAHDLLADRAVLRKVTPRISAPGDTDLAMERDPIARAVRIPGKAFLTARKALAEGAPVLVQVPRRGYIPALSCAKCRTPARCRHCNGPLALPESGSAAQGGPGPRTTSRELGIAAVRTGDGEAAHSPSCRWCGITEAAFRCGNCGSRALRAVVIGAVRTAEELGRAFPGVPIRGSGGKTVLSEVPAGPQVVVSTIGAEPSVPGGYGVALLLDGWALLSRADLRAAEDALRRWMSAAALVRPHGQVLVMAEPSLPTVQALVRWDPVGHAHFELEGRTEVRFPPSVRFAAIDGTTDTIAELLGEAKLPADVEVLGPVPLPFGARKPFSAGDTPAEVERMILRTDRAHGSALSRALTAALAVRSSHRSDGPLRVQIDPIDIG